ncbi:MAG: peptidase dimerization domain-containing protein [Planctomycetaceae bacterium]
MARLTKAERAEFAKLPFKEGPYLKEPRNASPKPHGEAGFTTLERRWARPTCDVNGMISGYTGVGPKTIIPAQATIKLTCRLRYRTRILSGLWTVCGNMLPGSFCREFGWSSRSITGRRQGSCAI